MSTYDPITATRESLHAVAELVLGGAQYAACRRITLEAGPNGFSTRFEPRLSVEGTELVGAFGRADLDGRTVRELCTVAGLPLTPLTDVYAEGAALGPDQPLSVEPAAATLLIDAWWTGHQALVLASPGASPILWPEHFDIGISVGQVNLGVSPGDAFLDRPYAYVGPWTVPEQDEFFDAPFGAARALSELGGAPEVAAFLSEGLSRAG